MALGGKCGDNVDYVEVGFVIKSVCEGIAMRADSAGCTAAIATAGKPAAGQGTPGDYPHAHVQAERDHFTFFFSIQQIVVVLHGNKLGPAMTLGCVLRLAEL